VTALARRTLDVDRLARAALDEALSATCRAVMRAAGVDRTLAVIADAITVAAARGEDEPETHQQVDRVVHRFSVNASMRWGRHHPDITRAAGRPPTSLAAALSADPHTSVAWLCATPPEIK
jgi:hypothetical protein